MGGWRTASVKMQRRGRQAEVEGEVKHFTTFYALLKHV